MACGATLALARRARLGRRTRVFPSNAHPGTVRCGQSRRNSAKDRIDDSSPRLWKSQKAVLG
ncbi:hypothetical protein L532_0259 [Bordetella bronchiseptica OSU095]|nr:hypothetical protein L576_0315 [Bordetella bronchiseptica OSU054]KDD44206.1 hypothetical protein L532_0259 [Bordetella bronchiseptica OSU095]KDD58552.1 hypothetical protein L533_0236 [Bordetella bronchiseptica OSU553]